MIQFRLDELEQRYRASLVRTSHRRFVSAGTYQLQTFVHGRLLAGTYQRWWYAPSNVANLKFLVLLKNLNYLSSQLNNLR